MNGREMLPPLLDNSLRSSALADTLIRPTAAERVASADMMVFFIAGLLKRLTKNKRQFGRIRGVAK
jgi:hypothetical protein